MGRKYYLDPLTKEKIYIRDKTPSLANYRTSADQDTIDSNFVTVGDSQTITGVKTFNGATHFIGSGDSNAVFISTNTRFDVEGTSTTVLGFSSSNYLLGSTVYELTLRGKETRPTYINASGTNSLALLTDLKLTDIQANGVSLVTDKVANLVFNTEYNSTSNKIATVADVKVYDIQANGTSLLTDKVANLVFNTAYDPSTNKIATMADIKTAIETAIGGAY